MLDKPTKTLFDELLALTAEGLDDENDRNRQRDLYIEEVFRYGGQKFVERVEKYGYTERGDKIEMYGWFREYLSLIGDYRVAHTITQGCSQTGKTAGHNLLLADTIVSGKLDCGWMFSSRDSREVNVPQQQRPTIEKYAEEYEKINNVKLRERADRKLSSRYQIGGITGIFSYLSTSKSSESKSGLAAAGASVVSFTAHVCFVEEAGQSTPEAAEVVMPRLAASKLATKPRRDLGTPGSGASAVDVIMTQTDRNFYPTVQCKSCRKYTPLHPFGCLLKPIQRKNQVGKMVTVYLSESGRPLEWHCRDSENPVDTAFIGCPNCGAELDNETRYSARYRCTRTQEWLSDYLANLPVDDPEACANLRHKIGIHISPLVRKTKHNLAADIIDKGLKSARTADFIQQVLGLTSDNFVTGITLEMLKKALAAPKPDGTPDFTLCGLDMGRAHDFLTITEFYLPEDYRYLDQVELSKRTIRRVVFSSEVIREKAKDIISRHKVAYGICDNEPGRDSVMTFCNEVGQLADIKLEMADQKDTLKDAVKLDKVKDGGAEYPCWFVRNQKFQDLILENFLELAEDGYCLYRLPEIWNKHLSSKSDLSPFKHLTSPTRDPESDRWVRAADGNDDLFYSFLFMEVAFYIYCEKMLKYPVWIGGV